MHSLPIRHGCVYCSAPIPYELGVSLALSPLCRIACGHDWVPSLTRPAGRCALLGLLAGQLMQRWAEYVRQVVTLNLHLGRDRSNGTENIFWKFGRH